MKAARRFIAHRGVHLHSTIAGENSLEAVRLAQRAGFACIETDVRLSADGEYVIMHDASIDRTATRWDGGELREPVLVAETSLDRLRSEYRLRARDPECRTRIPTAEEYFRACADAGLRPFIEIKPMDQPDDFYLGLLELADRVLGRGGYVMTSNGNANRIIRSLGIDDVPMMDIRYQAPSLDDVAALGDVIVAVSATRYECTEHLAHVAEARRAGLATESHADDFATFAVADEHGVDLISTDVLAPDLRAGTDVVLAAGGDGEFAAFRHCGSIVDGMLLLDAGARVSLPAPPHLDFGGAFLEAELEGVCRVLLGPQRFRIDGDGMRRHRHQVMLFDAPATLVIAAEEDCRIRDLRLTVARY